MQVLLVWRAPLAFLFVVGGEYVAGGGGDKPETVMIRSQASWDLHGLSKDEVSNTLRKVGEKEPPDRNWIAGMFRAIGGMFAVCGNGANKAARSCKGGSCAGCGMRSLSACGGGGCRGRSRGRRPATPPSPSVCHWCGKVNREKDRPSLRAMLLPIGEVVADEISDKREERVTTRIQRAFAVPPMPTMEEEETYPREDERATVVVEEADASATICNVSEGSGREERAQAFSVLRCDAEGAQISGHLRQNKLRGGGMLAVLVQ